MFPLHDNIPLRRLSKTVWLLVGLNCAAFVLELLLTSRGLEVLFYVFGIVPRRFSDPAWAQRAGFPPSSVLPFVTNLFLHAGWVHIISNMWTLSVFGHAVANRMTPIRFVFFYLICGVAANITHMMADPGATVPIVGASGAIAGIMGAYAMLYPFARVTTLVPLFFWPLFIEVPALFFMGVWFYTQLHSGTLALAAPGTVGGVAWWAHVGGFLAGLLLLPFFELGKKRRRKS